MSQLDAIRANARVVLSTSMLAETWQARRRTSDYSVDPPTYDAAVDVVGLFSNGGTQETYDDQRSGYKWSRVGTFRTADDALSPPLSIADRLVNGSETWAITSIQRDVQGSIAYGITLTTPMTGEPMRGGGA